MERRSEPQRTQGLHLVRAEPTGTPGEHPPCERCTSKCCRYIAIEVDRPSTSRDFDQIRWYLLHDGVVVWVQDGAWHVEFRTPCSALQSDGRCGIYDSRPQLCRDYGYGDTSPCDYWAKPSDFDLMFENAPSFEAWVESERARKARRREAARRRRAAGARA